MKTIVTGLILIAQITFAQTIEGETELAGFILGQYRKAVHAELGSPIEKRITKEGWIYEFHAIKPDTSVYALFKYANWDTTRIYAIQINGDKFNEMKSFRGLKLGSHKEEVAKVFGPESKSESLEDPPITVHYYDHKNYSFEIDKNDNSLYGIQIFGNILSRKPSQSQASLIDFKSAVLAKNADSLIANLRPDVEFYKGGNSFRYKGSARGEFKNPNSEVASLLIGETESIWTAFEVERAKSVAETQVYEDSGAVTTVYKFPDSKILEEIVFFPHAGRWKVYEVRFR